MSLTMENLNNCFDAALDTGAAFLAVAVSIKGQEAPEIIINENSSLPSKLKYYNEAYNNDLTHKHADGISIVGFAFGNSFGEIEQHLYAEDGSEILSIDDEDIAAYVYGQTGIDQEIALKVLQAEMEFYKKVGIVDGGEEE